MYPAGDHARYVDRLIEDLRTAGTWAAKIRAELPRRVDTLYLGGGTPSLLAPELLECLFAVIRAEFALDPDAEITMECAPGQLADATLAAMADCGVNRVSLGVQSFVDREAHESGRLHDRATIEADLRRLRVAGITNINIDLIAGLAGQTFASWEESLTALIGSGAPHASVYMLEVDEDSRLGRELLSGGARYRAGLVPHEDAIVRMYDRAIDRLAEAGLAQYEISNFAYPGYESRHNLRYWQRKPYLGAGLDASSMAFSTSGAAHAFRWTTAGDLRAYLETPPAPELTSLSLDRQHEEAWFLGLRLNNGIDVTALEQEFGSARVSTALETAKRLADDGLLALGDCHVRLTPRGRLFSNNVFQEFLAEPDVTSEQTPVISDAVTVR